MTRRSQPSDPVALRAELESLLQDFGGTLEAGDLRERVLALIPVHRLLRDLGSSLVPHQDASSARDRILLYMRRYPLTSIGGEELMVVAGISEWARRLRELRVEFGWSIVNGVTAKEMEAEGELAVDGLDVSDMGPDDYVMVGTDQDREAAHRWNIANEIRRQKTSVRDKILEYLKRNVGQAVMGEELRYVANNKTEWARRVRELRTEFGWPVVTKNTGRPDLGVGAYVLEQDRQSPAHDRSIPDSVRGEVLKRDGYKCQNPKCGWHHGLWNTSDPRHLELHHVKHHVDGGENTAANLRTLCTVCHDVIHSKHGE